jgi:hypothetical protein
MFSRRSQNGSGQRIPKITNINCKHPVPRRSANGG